jgi:hypothetical protein
MRFFTEKIGFVNCKKTGDIEPFFRRGEEPLKGSGKVKNRGV